MSAASGSRLIQKGLPTHTHFHATRVRVSPTQWEPRLRTPNCGTRAAAFKACFKGHIWHAGTLRVVGRRPRTTTPPLAGGTEFRVGVREGQARP